MSKVESALQTAVASIPECVAAGLVDMASGMLLGIKTVDSHPTEVMDLLAAATTDLFQGTSVSMIENVFKKARGLKENTQHYFQEIIVNSDNLIHVFIRTKNQNQVATFVCRKSANLGMVLTKARSSMPAIEAGL
jgi:hypothetical protein